MTNEVQENPDDQAIDDLFEDEPEIEAEQSEEVEDVKGEKEVAEKSEDDPEDTEPPAVKDPTLVPIAALQDERRKAQLLKEEVSQLKSQIPQPSEAPDPEENIDAYNAWMRNQWEQEQIDAQSAKFATLVEESRSAMLEKHDDYKKVEEVFYVLANLNEDLKQDMFDSKDPALFAYTEGKAYLQSLRDGALAEVEKDPIIPEKVVPSALNVPSLATATAQASNSIQVEKDNDLDDMFDDQKY